MKEQIQQLGQLEVLAQHGFGFDSEAWRKWLQDFGARSGFAITSICPDRGYYRASAGAKFQCTDSGALRIAIAHSLGVHLLPPTVIDRLDLLVCFSTFDQFHSLDPRRTQAVIRRMLARLEQDPAGLLRDFLLNCYRPKPAGMVVATAIDQGTLSLPALRSDLGLLNQSQLSIASLSRVPRILLIHGTADSVVDYRHSQTLHKLLPNSTLILFEGEGHALPFTNPSGCHLALRDAISDLARANISGNNKQKTDRSAIYEIAGKETQNMAALAI